MWPLGGHAGLALFVQGVDLHILSLSEPLDRPDSLWFDGAHQQQILLAILRRIWRRNGIGMEPEEMSSIIYLGRTLNWQGLKRFEASLSIDPLETIILVQKLNELVALTWKLCY